MSVSSKANSEYMEISFHVKEYSEPLKPFIEIEPKSKRISIISGDSDTLYLYLKDESSMKKAQEVAKYLRDNIAAISILKF